MKSLLNADHFTNEAVAIVYVEARLWPNGPVCPKCGTVGEATRSRGKTTRPGLWNCKPCRKPFTVKIGTVFESSHVPLHIWLQVIYLFCSSKKGFATRQIQRTLGCSMKTAWFLGHRVREAMTELGIDATPLGGPTGLSRLTRPISAARKPISTPASARISGVVRSARLRLSRLSNVTAACAASMSRTSPRKP